ncbi:hypothetical protein C8R44DRAFT_881714 [Mycena epipterygia]|nr:hypothetical protein C8R44DRAFT_881714 [Mycena epipterygia]
MAIVPGAKDSYAGCVASHHLLIESKRRRCSVFIENILCAFYLSVFIECCVLLRRKQMRDWKQIYLLATMIVMFILITMRFISDAAPCIIAFQPDGLHFGVPNSPMRITTNAYWFFVTAVADALIIFRTFIVWKNWYTPATIGLVFSYIIIRVSRGSSYGDTTGRVDTSLSRDRNNFELSQTRNGRSGTRSEVQVKLERVVVQHNDVDSESRDDDSNSKKYPDASMV